MVHWIIKIGLIFVATRADDIGFCKGRVAYGSTPGMGIARCLHLSGNRHRLFFDTTGDLKPEPDGYRTLLSAPLLPSEHFSGSKIGTNLIGSTKEHYLTDIEAYERVGALKNWIFRFPKQYPMTLQDCGFTVPEFDDSLPSRTALRRSCEGESLAKYCTSYRTPAGKSLVEIKISVTVYIPTYLIKLYGSPQVEVSLPDLAAKKVRYRNIAASLKESIWDKESTLTLSTIMTQSDQATLYHLSEVMHRGIFLKMSNLQIPAEVPGEIVNNIYIAAMASCA